MVEDTSELLHTPKKRDASFYVVLLFFVGPIWIITPISWINVIFCIVDYKALLQCPSRQVLFAATLCEVCTCLCHAPACLTDVCIMIGRFQSLLLYLRTQDSSAIQDLPRQSR